jgi:hypothetical protein
VKTLTCPATRRRLHAFHDDQLSMEDQVAVSSHLAWCDDCVDRLGELRWLRQTLRAAAHSRQAVADVLGDDTQRRLQDAIVYRAAAERTVSFRARLGRAVEDVHVVYAGIGAALAVLVCAVIMLGVVKFATSEQRPDSFAAILRILASPGSNQNPLPPRRDVQMPRPLNEDLLAVPLHIGLGDDALFMLRGVVTQEGRIDYIELLNAGRSVSSGVDEATVVGDLMGTVADAQFHPGSRAGLPVAVDMVWIVAHTTVRASKVDLPTSMPPVKRRIA